MTSNYTPEREPQPPDVVEALEVVEGIADVVERVSTGRVSDDGAGYLESVLERANSIGKTIERTNRVSVKQRTALDNMLAGVRKWDHSDR